MNMLIQSLLTAIMLLAGSTVLAAEQKNICPNEHIPYCSAVGKEAYNNEDNPPQLQGLKIGRIIGVAAGSEISKDPVASSNLIDKPPHETRDIQYSYIIDIGAGQIVVRSCAEIISRSPE